MDLSASGCYPLVSRSETDGFRQTYRPTSHAITQFISLDTLRFSYPPKGFLRRFPPKSVVVTMDDGHAGNIELLPLFKQYHVRPTLYVCTQIIDTHRHFWFKIDGQSKAEKERLKGLSNVERLTHLKNTAGFEPEKGVSRQTGTQCMTEMEGNDGEH